MKKRIMSGLLVVAMLISLVGVMPALAAAGPTVSSVELKLLEDGGADSSNNDIVEVTVTGGNGVFSFAVDRLDLGASSSNITYLVEESDNVVNDTTHNTTAGFPQDDTTAVEGKIYAFEFQTEFNSDKTIPNVRLTEAHYNTTGEGTTKFMFIAKAESTAFIYGEFSVNSEGNLVETPGTAMVEITAPAANGSVVNAWPTITASVAAANTAATDAVSAVAYSAKRVNDSTTEYLTNATTWGNTETWIDLNKNVAQGATESNIAIEPTATLTDGDAITVTVRSTDGVGKVTASRTFTVDKTAPTVTSIARCASDGTTYNGNGYFKSGDNVYFKVTYDEPVMNVSNSDFALTGCSATYAGTGDAVNTSYYTNWIATITGTTEGEVKLATATASWTAEDRAGNTVAADQDKSATYTYDTTAPVIASIKVGGDAGTDIQTGAATDSALSGSIVVAVTEANPVITGSVSSLNNIAGVAIVKSSSASTAEAGKITAAAFGTGGKLTITYSGLEVATAYKLVIGANVIADLAGNKLASTTTSANAFTTTNGIAVEPTFADGSATINKVYGGEKFTNAATVNTATYPGASATVGYTSSATNVADVNATTGEVTINGAGTATITATTSSVNGSNGGTPYVTGGAKTYTLVVARKDIQTNVASLSFSKGYDGANTLTLAELQTSGFGSVEGGKYYLATGVGTEKLEITATTATYNATNKGESVGATATAITFADNSTTALAANYKIGSTDLATSGSSTSLSSQTLGGAITAKALTWKETTAAMSSLGKVYDGTRTAKVAGTINETANTYLVGVASGDQTNVKLTIAVGDYTDAYAAADVADQDVTLPASALSLTGTGANNYTLPGSGTGIKAAISQATPSLTLGNLTQTAGSITAVTVTANPASTDFAGVVEYKVPLALTYTVTAANCDCGAAETGAHDSGCPAVACTCGADAAIPAATKHDVGCTYAGNGTGTCNCTKSLVGTENQAHTNGCPVVDCTCAGIAAGVAIGTKHATSCAYGGSTPDHTQDCDCSFRATLTDVADHTSGCAAVVADAQTYEWKKFGDAPTDGTLGLTVGAWLNSLPAGTNVDVRATSTASTNLAAQTTPVSGTLAIQAAYVPPMGGGVSSYTVTYNVGEHGKLAEGAKKTESVNYKKSPSKVPEVVANEGYKFLGWSLDGKTQVDPTAEIITKSITFTALYEAAAKELAFEKEFTAAYMVGMEEGGEKVFKPEAPMTRGEVAVMLARTLTSKMEDGKNYAADKFPDLKGDEWYAQSVGFLAELGVMKGLEDGTCGAEKYITRAEFVALVMRIDGIVTGENRFPDVSADNWAAEPIIAAAAKGYVSGNELGNFMPGENITRASVVKIMNGVLGWSWNAEGEMTFTDVTEGHWAYNDIIKASTGK